MSRTGRCPRPTADSDAVPARPDDDDSATADDDRLR
jgi:hypothetical protein